MEKVVIVTALFLFMLAPGAHGAAAVNESPEGCQVQNPAQPKCTYTVTHESGTPVTGFLGVGEWVAKIKRGKQVITEKSPPGGGPASVAFEFEKGDKVTLTAVSPGSAATAGHVD